MPATSNTDKNTTNTSGNTIANYEVIAPRILLKPGLILNDKWKILEHIASGGKGDVYRAHQKSLERNVALKVISSNFLGSFKDDAGELEAERERFRREVRVMASIRHPNVLQVFDFDMDSVNNEALEYIVMEYIPGSTLRSTMTEQGCGLDKSAVTSWLKQYFMPVLQGLVAVHEAGVIHRDIKPENIMLDGSTPKIADFGLARAQHNPGMTQTFQVLGTIFYMPKEQFEDGASVDARADIYALGKILFELVHGKIANKSNMAFKQARLDLSACPVEDKEFFQTLDRIIQNATAEETQERTPTATALYNNLDALADYSAEGLEAKGRRKLKTGMRALYAALGIVAMGGAALLLHHFLNQPPGQARQADQASQDNPAADVQPVRITQDKPYESQPQPGTKLPEGSPTHAVDGPDGNGHTKSQRLVESDGAVMNLVKGGTAAWRNSANEPQQASIRPFYLEEKLVTNGRFVDFLNAVRDTLNIQDGVVQGADGIYMLLDEVREGYEPILFRDGAFVLASPELADRPVVRVSPKGAEAYAHYYNRALPTVPQWLVARANSFGLGNRREISGEWGYENSDDGHRFLLLEAGEKETRGSENVCPPMRQKWEAFPDVGFRTVRNTAALSGE